MKRTTPQSDNESQITTAAPVSRRFSLHEPRNTKRLQLIRHGEALHNKLAREKGPEVYLDPILTDPSLTEMGVGQAKSLHGKLKSTDLLIVSPLERTMETALHIFDAFEDHAKLPIALALDEIREVSGKHYPDKRQAISSKKSRFPTINFSHIKEDEDTLWITEHREPRPQVSARVTEFLQFLWTRPEHHITVVSHHGLLDCMYELLTGSGFQFANCEVREVILVQHM